MKKHMFMVLSLLLIFSFPLKSMEDDASPIEKQVHTLTLTIGKDPSHEIDHKDVLLILEKIDSLFEEVNKKITIADFFNIIEQETEPGRLFGIVIPTDDDLVKQLLTGKSEKDAIEIINDMGMNYYEDDKEYDFGNGYKAIPSEDLLEKLRSHVKSKIYGHKKDDTYLNLVSEIKSLEEKNEELSESLVSKIKYIEETNEELNKSRDFICFLMKKSNILHKLHYNDNSIEVMDLRKDFREKMDSLNISYRKEMFDAVVFSRMDISTFDYALDNPKRCMENYKEFNEKIQEYGNYINLFRLDTLGIDYSHLKQKNMKLSDVKNIKV